MAIKIGNAPCSWGVIENVAGKRSGYEVVIDEIRDTGYIGTELGDWGFMPTEPEKLKEVLAQRGLELTGSWVNVYLSHRNRFRESVDNCLKVARLLAEVCDGKPYINLGDEVYEIPNRTKKAGRIQPADAIDPHTRKLFMSNVNMLCDEVSSETGVSVLFHHHVGTWIETPVEIDQLLNESKVNICFDSGHCMFGGGEPLTMLKKYRERVGAVHFKDCSRKVAEKSVQFEYDAFESLKQGIFPELGQGNIDFPALTKHLKDTAYDGWIIVEQDVIPGMGNPKLSAQRNRNYLKNLGL